MVSEAPQPHLTADAIELVLYLESENIMDADPKAFGGGHVDLPLLHLYPDHITKHIWDGKVELVRFILFNLRLFYLTSL